MKTFATFALTAIAVLSFAACDSVVGPSSSLTADAGGDQTVAVGVPASLDGTGSSDGDGASLTYAWSFVSQPGGSSAPLTGTSATASFTPDVAGAYVVRLSVSNGTNTDTDEVTVTAEQGQITELDGDVTADRTLAAGLYTVRSGLTIRVTGAALTLSPGVRIDFGAGAGLQINSDGALVSAGTATQPVTLQGGQPSPGYWSGVAVYSSDVRNRLAHTTVAHGGGGRYSGMFAAANVALNDGARLQVEDSAVRDGGNRGISADPGATFPSFARNTLTGNAGGPLLASPMAADALDATSTYSGNAEDAVDLYDNNVTADMSLAALDVPYRIEGTPNVDNAFLTLEAGVEILFEAGAGLQVDSDGALRVEGTADRPVTLRGEQATPGYWSGVAIYSNDTRNVIANAVVAYGGGGRYSGLGAPANVALNDSARLTLSGSTIRDSAGWGIQADSNVVLTQSGNTFSNNASGNVNGG